MTISLWSDTQGQALQAHGGGMLHFKDRWYWYGENKDGLTSSEYGVDRVDFIGVSCYSSSDLLHWTNEGLVLTAVQGDLSHDLHPSKVGERPKVVFNAQTAQFVMWLHLDSADYGDARAGVAVSQTPLGPFRYLGGTKPCGADSRDLTVFQDDDGAAYLVFASEYNRNLTIARLNDDYLSVSDAFVKVLSHPRQNEGRESPVMFKHAGRYHLITSGCTGWAANAAEHAVAPAPFGPWTVRGNPCRGPGAEVTYGAQPTYAFASPTHPEGFVLMLDVWNPFDLRSSSYLWLELRLEGDHAVVEGEPLTRRDTVSVESNRSGRSQ